MLDIYIKKNFQYILKLGISIGFLQGILFILFFTGLFLKSYSAYNVCSVVIWNLSLWVGLYFEKVKTYSFRYMFSFIVIVCICGFLVESFVAVSTYMLYPEAKNILAEKCQTDMGKLMLDPNTPKVVENLMSIEKLKDGCQKIAEMYGTTSGFFSVLAFKIVGYAFYAILITLIYFLIKYLFRSR